MHEEVEPSMFFGLIALFVALVALNAAVIGYYASDYAVTQPAAATAPMVTTAAR